MKQPQEAEIAMKNSGFFSMIARSIGFRVHDDDP